MNQNKLALLQQELQLLDRAREVLQFSYHRCCSVGKKAQYTPEEEERFESLTGRFARISDVLTQKVFRLIDSMELEDEGTVRDRINRAEKKGLVRSADEFIAIRELRNRIAHEYVPEAIHQIFHQVLDKTPILFDTAHRVAKMRSPRFRKHRIAARAASAAVGTVLKYGCRRRPPGDRSRTIGRDTPPSPTLLSESLRSQVIKISVGRRVSNLNPALAHTTAQIGIREA